MNNLTSEETELRHWKALAEELHEMLRETVDPNWWSASTPTRHYEIQTRANEDLE